MGEAVVEPEQATSNTDPDIHHVYSDAFCTDECTFDATACACVHIEQCEADCTTLFPETPVMNPLQTCECISQESYEEIYNHMLGEDCIADTPDDPHDELDPEVTHVTEDECETWETFDQAACACAVDTCDIDCETSFPATPVQNPFEICECITQVDLDAIYDHGLGDDCTLLTSNEDFEAEHTNNEECAEGEAFNEAACACGPVDQCDLSCADIFLSTPFLNPLVECECISLEDYDAIFDHGLG